MAPLETPKPATARHGEPASKSEQLGGPLDVQNNDSLSGFQESDCDYFATRQIERTRLRLPFPGEFEPVLLEAVRGKSGGAVTMVAVAIERDASGSPVRLARGLVFGSEGMA